jgi:hypothetical protein
MVARRRHVLPSGFWRGDGALYSDSGTFWLKQELGSRMPKEAYSVMRVCSTAVVLPPFSAFCAFCVFSA